MIDWTKPLETTPDALNPVPVPCRRMPEHDVDVDDGGLAIYVDGDWIRHEGDDPRHVGHDFWWYLPEEGGSSNHWLPVLRNRVEGDPA